ncbi:MAG: ThuA domain-containing protein [Verrucomicrobiota bacterium]
MNTSLFLRSVFAFTLFVGIEFAAPALGDTPKARRLLLIGQGPDGHPPSTHEYMAGVRLLEKLLAPIPGLQTTVVRADEPWTEGPALIDQADGVVMFVTQGARWIQNDPKRHAALKRLAQRKGGIVALHWAVGATNAQYIEGQLELLGGTRGGPQRKYKVLETKVQLADRQHPIATGLSDFTVLDEFYYRLDFVKPGIHPLLTARIDDNDETVCWSWERPDGGHSFGFVGLHFHSNWQRPEYRRLVVQGILWTLALPIPQEGVKVEIDPGALELN